MATLQILRQLMRAGYTLEMHYDGAMYHAYARSDKPSERLYTWHADGKHLDLIAESLQAQLLTDETTKTRTAHILTKGTR